MEVKVEVCGDAICKGTFCVHIRSKYMYFIPTTMSLDRAQNRKPGFQTKPSLNRQRELKFFLSICNYF